MNHTFEDLIKMKTLDLEIIRDEKREKLYNLKKEKEAIVGNILALQQMITEEIASR